MTRECRPCRAYAVEASRFDMPVHKVQPGRSRVAWPPRGRWHDEVFGRCRQAVVWTCEWHRRVSLWPRDLTVALWAETERTGPASGMAPLDNVLRAYAAGAPPPTRMYGARPGEDRAAVIAAYRETGSYAAAGRRLDERGVPTRKGAPWLGSMVKWIVELDTMRVGAMA